MKQFIKYHLIEYFMKGMTHHLTFWDSLIYLRLLCSVNALGVINHSLTSFSRKHLIAGFMTGTQHLNIIWRFWQLLNSVRLMYSTNTFSVINHSLTSLFEVFEIHSYLWIRHGFSHLSRAGVYETVFTCCINKGVLLRRITLSLGM